MRDAGSRLSGMGTFSKSLRKKIIYSLMCSSVMIFFFFESITGGYSELGIQKSL